MGVDLKRVYAKVAESKRTNKGKVYLKVSNNGAVLGINGSKEKVEDAVRNLYANQRDIIDFSKLASAELSKYHMILIGSHDKKPALSDRFKKYIEDGGYLVTTGRCLDTIIAGLFPDIISYDKKEIKGGAFKGEISSLEHPLIRGATKKKALKFWVEDKSHPIKKVKPVIQEIVTSKKLQKKYGSGAILISFNYGEGMIVHMLPRLHPSQSNEQLHYTSAYLLSNILDEAVNKKIPDEIRTATDARQVSYVNMVIIDDPSKKCAFCESTFKDYEGKVFRCSACNSNYHEFCLEQQLGRDGICNKCKKLMIYEKYKGAINAAAVQTYPQPPTPPPEQRQREGGAPPPPPG